MTQNEIIRASYGRRRRQCWQERMARCHLGAWSLGWCAHHRYWRNFWHLTLLLTVNRSHTGYLADKLSRKYTIVLGRRVHVLCVCSIDFFSPFVPAVVVFCVGVVVQTAAAEASSIYGGASYGDLFTHETAIHFMRILRSIRDWFGCWFPLNGCPFVQRRNCSARSPGQFSRPSTARHHIRHPDLILDRFRYVLREAHTVNSKTKLITWPLSAHWTRVFRNELHRRHWTGTARSCVENSSGITAGTCFGARCWHLVHAILSSVSSGPGNLYAYSSNTSEII